MGAWGTGAFENDDAADWGGNLAEGGTPGTVRDALKVVAESPSEVYVEAPEAAEALAAAEVVAGAAGRPTKSDAYSEAALGWAARHPEIATQDHVDLALAVIDRVRSPESELQELWAEAGEEAEWTSALDDLRRRLTGPS